MLEDETDTESKEHIITILATLRSCPLFPIRMSTLCVNLTIINIPPPPPLFHLAALRAGDEEGSLSQDATLSLHSEATLAIPFSIALLLCL